MKVTVQDYLSARVGKPSVNAPTYKYLSPGNILEVDNNIYLGDSIEGSNHWLKDAAGNYYWAGATSIGKNALSDAGNQQPFTAFDVDSSNPGSNAQQGNYKSLYYNSGLYNPLPADEYCNVINKECVVGIDKQTPKSGINFLKDIVIESKRLKKSLRAVGHGCSYSDISLAQNGTIIDTNFIKNLDPDWKGEFLKTNKGYLASNYISTLAGTNIKLLNNILQSKKKAMIVLGGADVQTVGGVISTATHGSGIAFNSISDYVRSIVIMNDEGQVHRIEPSDGITDVARYKSTYGAELIQRDDLFYSVLVGMGCMGIIYSVVLEVRDQFLLSERKSPQKWSEVKLMIFKKPLTSSYLAEHPHVEFAINPYKTQGKNGLYDNDCCLTTVDESQNGRISGHRPLLFEIGSITDFAPQIAYSIDRGDPSGIPKGLSKALDIISSSTSYTDYSFNVYNKRMGTFLDNGIGIEAIVELDKGPEVLEALMQELEELAKGNQISQYLTSPIGVRFVKASKAYMSMFYNIDPNQIYMVMEIPVVALIINEKTYTDGVALLTKLQKFLIGEPYNARIHWGLSFKDSGINEEYARKAYPKYDDFKGNYKNQNKNNGFKNEFTERLGLDS